MKIDPNAPAYPHYETYETGYRPGLTIRAEFAARFYEGRLRAHKDEDEAFEREWGIRMALRDADALIAALNAEPKP